MRHEICSGLALLVLIASSLKCEASITNGLSDATSGIVKKIETINIVMGQAVGAGGSRPEQYDIFLTLTNNAKTSELIQLTKHPNPTVRCYAFWALTRDESVDVFPLVLDHLGDNELVETQFGCIRSSETVADFFCGMVPERLNTAQLDTILINGTNDLYSRDRAIRRLEPTEDIYPRILELVTDECNEEALVLLAKYQKEKDVPLILNFYRTLPEQDDYFFTYRAISTFPHPDFMPLLEQNLDQTFDCAGYDNEWREMYKAIASYQSERAFQLLTKPFTQVQHAHIKKYHLSFVFDAVMQYQDPVYDDLLWRLWEEGDEISIASFYYLFANDEENAYRLTRQSLLRSYCYFNREDLMAAMLDFTLRKDKQFAYEMIGENIRDINVHLFPVFSDKAAEIKDESFINPLFYRLKAEENSHIYLEAAKVLIAYNDSDMDRRVIKILEKKKLFKNSGDAMEFLSGERGNP